MTRGSCLRALIATPIFAIATMAAPAAIGETLRDCPECPELVVVPGGSFVMGAAETEPGYSGDESPQHQVTVPSFAAGAYEVTFDEWDACVTASGCDGYTPKDMGWGRGRHPVVNVSWEDVQKYLAWLSAKTGKSYRLLSEAEWEYAARGNAEGGASEPPFWWGTSIEASQANYDASVAYGGGSTGEYRQRTLEVGSFQPNAFGLYDVHGNAAEWVQDCHANNYLKMPVRGAPPEDGSAWEWSSCSSRDIRGGSYIDLPSALRVATRDASDPGVRQPNLGFRVARNN